MNIIYGVSWFFMLLGLVFFIAGSVGLLRFPDQFSRLHAVTKADTMGLGLVVLGLSLQSTWREALLMVLIWLILMSSGAVSCQLLARFSRDTPQLKQAEESEPAAKLTSVDTDTASKVAAAIPRAD